MIGTHLGQLDAAKEHLDKSYELGDAKQIKLMALDDEDLKPLWEGEAQAYYASAIKPTT